MSKRIDLTGQRFGMLVVLSRAKSTNNGTMWLCKCDCGVIKTIRTNNLRMGTTKSCGCAKSVAHTKHNCCRRNNISQLYVVWNDMKQRCYNPNSIGYRYYGDRGIKICDEWLGENGFASFRNWAYANGYKEETLPNGRTKWTIDRIDSNGNYEPTNCRWVDMLTQNNNTRCTRHITYNGETLTLTQAAHKYKISRVALENRINNGWSVEAAIETPLRTTPTHVYNGQSYTSSEIQKVFGIPSRTFRRRLQSGMTVSEAVETPLGQKVHESIAIKVGGEI